MGRRGLVGLFTTHGAKGRGIESRSFSFFYSFPIRKKRRFSRKKKRKSTKVSRREESEETRERRIEEEEPAGVSGMDTRSGSVRLEND